MCYMYMPRKYYRVFNIRYKGQKFIEIFSSEPEEISNYCYLKGLLNNDEKLLCVINNHKQYK